MKLKLDGTMRTSYTFFVNFFLRHLRGPVTLAEVDTSERIPITRHYDSYRNKRKLSDYRTKIPIGLAILAGLIAIGTQHIFVFFIKVFAVLTSLSQISEFVK